MEDQIPETVLFKIGDSNFVQFETALESQLCPLENPVDQYNLSCFKISDEAQVSTENLCS